MRCHLILSLFILFTALFQSACTPVTVVPEVTEDEIAHEKARLKRSYLKDRFDEEERVLNIGYPILKAGLEFCEEGVWTTGLRVWNINSFDFSRYRDFAEDEFSLDRGLKVKYVIKGFPADKAGVKKDAHILAVDGKDLKKGSGALRSYTKAMDKNEKASVRYLIEQNGIVREYDVPKVAVCKSPIVYHADDGAVNAYADGKAIHFTRGIVNFIDNDDELANVMGHELAHNIMHHIDKGKINRAIGRGAGYMLDVFTTVVTGYESDTFESYGLFGGHMVHSPLFEIEADYVGYYITARAGYDIDQGYKFFERLASLYGASSIDYTTTHPADAERIVISKKIIAEIKEKQAKDHVLIPNVDPAEWSRRNLDYAHGQDHYNR